LVVGDAEILCGLIAFLGRPLERCNGGPRHTM
jgi:hypothetical protein